MGALAVAAVPAAISAVGSLFGGKSQSKATTQASNASIAAAQRAAELQAQSAAEALAFSREQEAARQREWQTTQDTNYNIWKTENDWNKWLSERQFGLQTEQLGLSREQLAQAKWLAEQQLAQSDRQFGDTMAFNREKQAYIRALEDARQNRLRPYQGMGTATLGQLAAPMVKG